MHTIDGGEGGAGTATTKRLAVEIVALGFVALFWGIPEFLWSRGNDSARRVALLVYRSAEGGYRAAPLSA